MFLLSIIRCTHPLVIFSYSSSSVLVNLSIPLPNYIHTEPGSFYQLNKFQLLRLGCGRMSVGECISTDTGVNPLYTFVPNEIWWNKNGKTFAVARQIAQGFVQDPCFAQWKVDFGHALQFILWAVPPDIEVLEGGRDTSPATAEWFHVMVKEQIRVSDCNTRGEVEIRRSNSACPRCTVRGVRMRTALAWADSTVHKWRRARSSEVPPEKGAEWRQGNHKGKLIIPSKFQGDDRR
ncbi:hypothetical protein BU15DRAFT_65149 [Melanogaster broomeanus]|nr:hypothetical protein BU15DRAFT_65149 [Melanogaster broomeanus]